MASEETTRFDQQNEPADDNQEQFADVHQNEHIDCHQEKQRDTLGNPAEILLETETNHEGSIAHTTTTVDIQIGDPIESGSSLDLLPVERVEKIENDTQQPTKNGQDTTVTNAINVQPARKCEPCLHRNIEMEATKYCKECDELYCNQCTSSHTSQKQTKNHPIIGIEELESDLSVTKICDSQMCEPCQFKEKTVEALYICETCDENLCEDCRLFHLAQKRNRDHIIRSLMKLIYCETCNTQGKEGIVATKYCIDCKDPETFCELCAEQHTAMKLSRNHRFSPDLTKFIARCKEYEGDMDISEKKQVNTFGCGDLNASDSTDADVTSQINTVLLCEPCSNQDLPETATHYCLTCDERYCHKCTKRHKAHKQTENHEILDLSTISDLTRVCDCCKYNGEDKEATHTCTECNESLCSDCVKYHRSQKQTRTHQINPISAQPFCEICLEDEEKHPATSYCLDCDEPELLCDSCAKHHLSVKLTRNHNISKSLVELPIMIIKKNNGKFTTRESTGIGQKQESVNCPGQPYVTEAANMSNYLIVKWEDAILAENDAYQLVYKEGKEGKWKTCRNTTQKSTFKLEGLQPQTSYIFRVRVVNDLSGKEGPFSPESDLIATTESTALDMMKKSDKIYDKPIGVYALPLIELKDGRNEKAKTRKMYLGEKDNILNEKNIMIVGATGSGKSTLINAMANYILGVTWEDPFRFTLVNVETCEQARAGNQAHSQTEWITCYTIYKSVSSRLQYTINLIDTPGFGDTRGLDHDRRIVDQIRELFTARGNKGVVTIDAVCFILKAPDARLTPTQMYIFEEILSLFGNDIQENICTLITFADGQRPPVLAGLEALEHKSLPYEQYFTFNNSALFTENSSNDPQSLSPTFWEMGIRSCEAFFEHLTTLQKKSLQLTSEVLVQRERLENTIQHLYQEVDSGLSKINVLEQEIEIFTKYRRQIRENKNFTYTVTENVQEIVDLTGKSQYTTNCLACNFTCHDNCAYANDSDKANCCAMGKDGNCTECPSNCHWTQHKNNPFIIKLIPKIKTKQYSEKQKIYQEATQKSLTQEQVLEEMSKDIERLEYAITDRMERIAQYNNRLKEIALRPDPCSTVHYIDLMIEGEKREKKKGYLSRIDALEKCKKRVQYGKSVQIFQDRVRSTRRTLNATVNEDADMSYENTSSENTFIGAVKNFGKKVIHAIKI